MSTAASPAADKSFMLEARAANVAWKETTRALPEEARAAGDYGRSSALPFCIPGPQATLNLLPDAREIALSRFEAAAIRWHGDTGSPSNHLLSSQIQCLNALAPLVGRPEDLQLLLSEVLPIAEVLPFGAPSDGAGVSPFEADDHVVFEWQGLADHLNEWPPAGAVRGAYATSADAALRYRTTKGTVELALIEWKYTERYPDGKLSGGESKNTVRRERYQALFEDPGGPIDTDQVGLDDLLGEPVYQLTRLALLAHQMTAVNELGADAVRVVYAAPERNRALWASHGTPAVAEVSAAHGNRLDRAWSTLLLDPETFVLFDTARLVEPTAVTSEEFRWRYGHLAG